MPNGNEHDVGLDDDLDMDEVFAGVEAEVSPPPPPPTPAAPPPGVADDEDEDDNPLEAMGLQQESRDGIGNLSKPWMRFHRFVLVKTIEQVREVVDKAFGHGRCALDLETEGFDNRIEYDAEGRPYTRHKIVSYCISVRGTGYYLPLRHEFNENYDEKDPNLPIEATDAEIKRLCLASQPTLTEEGREQDPYSSTSIAEPGKMLIYFWNAKFDQEFLWPITGIDFWHPESFEDGLLSAYVVYTDDKNLGLKVKSDQRLRITDPETGIEHPYEMIKFNDLFTRRTPKHERKIQKSYPFDGANVVLYGCSDGICTELLCEARKTAWEHTIEVAKFDYAEVVTPSKQPRFRNILRLEKQTVMAVRVMERSRTKVDKKAIEALLKEAYVERQVYEDKIVTLAKGKGFDNFNPGSTAQLSDFLFTSRGLDIKPKPEKNEKSGQYKTDASTLEGFVESDPEAPDVLKWIVKYRQIDKIIGTYLKGLAANTDEHDQLRFNFRQTGAATGRFTAPKGDADHGFAGVPIHGIPVRNDPNKPKVAHSLRGLFVSHPGYVIVKIDYAGQELRVVTCISGEPVWKREFKEGSGDLHTLTAQSFFGAHITRANKLERNMGKIANFSLIYGGGTQAIMRATKCDKVEAARKKSAFDKSVPTFAKWVKKQHSFVKKNLGVYTGFGRFVAIPDANIKVGDTDSNNRLMTEERIVRKIRAGCERKSTNYPIQGSGADILKISLVKLVKELHRLGWLKRDGDDSVRMLMTVHDEIVFEIKLERLMEAIPIIVDIMESPSRLVGWDIPLIVEPLLGGSWGAKHDWLEMMDGKEPVPDWLEGHVEPTTEWKRPIEDKPAARPPAARPPPATPTAEPVSKESVAPVIDLAEARKARQTQIAIFAIPHTYLTSQSIRLVMQAVDGAIPVGSETDLGKYKRLHLTDGQGNTLIDPKLGIRVEPDEFSRGLKNRNLGPGTYDIIDEVR